jgi:hypothetical protein
MREGLIDLLQSQGIAGIDADELLDDIFYNNGKHFVLNRVRTMRG